MDTLPDYGLDIDWGQDLNPDGSTVSGLKLLRQSALHLLTTPKGSCLDSPDAGIDVTEFLHEPLTEAQRSEIPGLVRQALLDDERFLGVDVTMQETIDGFTLVISITPDGSGPFDLVLDVSAAFATMRELTPSAE